MKGFRSTLIAHFERLLAHADIRIGGERPWDFQVKDERTFDLIARKGRLGLGEAYMNGWWEADALDEFFFRLTRRLAEGQKAEHAGGMLSRCIPRLFNLQNRILSRRVAEKHYDIGNAFYEAMLGPTMQYTCAYWKDADNLDDAQEAKLDLVCRKLELSEGEHILDLGCGWGGFARYAASRYGCEVTAYNISKEQVAYAREWNKNLPVRIVEGDYRDAEGRFDKIASIGLTEHIGPKNYAGFYKLQRRCLKEDGLVLQHTIGSSRTTWVSDPWFTKYIFPGGHLPSVWQLSAKWEGRLTLEDLHNFGQDYDKTLMAWHANFEAAWPQFRDTFGERFHRMWRYYLLSCAGAFRARNIQLWQLVFSPGGRVGGYFSKR